MAQHCSPTLYLMQRNLNKWYRRKAEFDSVWDTLSFSTWFNLKTSEVHDCCALQKKRRFQSPTNGRRQSSSTERNQPLYSVTLLHQRSLVHGPDPAIHVLLCVRTEEICPHPAVFCLWANHRVPIVNVGAHSCMGRLSKRERERSGGWENERMDMRTSHWRQEKAVREAEEWKTLLSCLPRLKDDISGRTKFTATFNW